MAIITVKIYKAFGGRSTRDQWVNTYDIETDNAIGSPELDTEVDSIVNMEKIFHLSTTYFMRVVVSTYAKEGRAGHPEAMRVRELAGVGSRGAAQGNDALPLDVCLGVRVSGATGRSGLMLYRGVLTEADVTGGTSGEFNYVPGGTGATEALTQFMANVARAVLVMPQTGSVDGTPARVITEMKEAGVVVKKTVQRRKKKAEVNESNLLDNLDVILGLGAGALTLILTKGRGLEPALKAAAALRAAGVGSIIGQIVEELAKLEL